MLYLGSIPHHKLPQPNDSPAQVIKADDVSLLLYNTFPYFVPAVDPLILAASCHIFLQRERARKHDVARQDATNQQTMAEAYQKEFFNVSFPAEYVAHVEINRPEKMNAFKEV